MTRQKIYDIALDRPKEGFEDSRKFLRSPNLCPKCGETLWLRIRHATGTVIGITCGSCPWRTTYRLLTVLPDAPPQSELRL